jgi:hypothetical protein
VYGARSRFGLERTEGSLGYHRKLAGESRIDVQAGVHRIAYVEGECCDDPSLDDQIAAGAVMAPPGYRAPYTSAFGLAELTLDTRRPAPEPGGGGFLVVHGAPSVELGDGRTWLAYGGAIGGAVDLTGTRRTLRLQLSADFVDSIGHGTIPFTEYPMLGGVLMPGFLPGWLTDRSTAAAQLAYTWPVWLWLDAQARFGVGDAFGEHLAGFSPGKLRMSADVGFATSTVRAQGFEVLVGLGSETFDQGARIASVRVTVGSRRGF